MSTNYFWRYNHCAGCGRYDEAHVGSTMRAWQGYAHELLDPEHPDWGYRHESPFGFPIASLADWRRVFTETAGELWDEYGRKVDVDPVAWLDSATPNPDHHLYGNDWIDPQGFYFIGGWFR